MDRKLADPKLGRENIELERLLLHWLLRCSAHHSRSSASPYTALWGFWCSLRWDPTRWWWRRFLWWATVRVIVSGAELSPVTAAEVWEGSV